MGQSEWGCAAGPPSSMNVVSCNAGASVRERMGLACLSPVYLSATWKEAHTTSPPGAVKYAGVAEVHLSAEHCGRGAPRYRAGSSLPMVTPHCEHSSTWGKWQLSHTYKRLVPFLCVLFVDATSPLAQARPSLSRRRLRCIPPPYTPCSAALPLSMTIAAMGFFFESSLLCPGLPHGRWNRSRPKPPNEA